MSMADYRKEVGISANKPAASPKYHNKITIVDGIRFASILEANRYGDLKLLLAAGQIKRFKRQPSFLFECGIRYMPDFIVWGLNGIPWVEDSKGKKTADFIMKEKLWKDEYPDMELRVIG
jgi:hypothetical protein